MRWIADLAYIVAGLLYLPIALYHAVVVGKNRHGWKERFGFVRTFDPDKKRIWIHAVSLGEVNATPQLAQILRERFPDSEIVFSTTTDTGFARATQLYGRRCVFRFPLDFSMIVSRVLKRVRPTLIVLVELEVWHNLVRLATRRGISVVVVNGRLTQRSARRLRYLGPAVRSMFRDLAWVGAQDEAIASRFRDMGARDDCVEVTSSLKWDSATVADDVEGADELAQATGLDRSRPLWVCGSTGPGEESQILEAYRKLCLDRSAAARGVVDEASDGDSARQPVLALVPRKPERFDEVARLIERAGFACVRRSDHGDGTRSGALAESTVLLGDTMGELRKFYCLADVVFVGRTLVPMGGSDPMEVAALGKPIVVGPHTDNFRMPVGAMRAADAIREIESAEDLPGVIGGILDDSDLASRLGLRGRQVVVEHQGATRRTADAIVRVLASR